MSGPTFSSPSVEVAEMNRIQFELEYTEGISQRMRIPETLKVGPDHQAVPLPLQEDLLGSQTTIMQVPERIVVAGEDGDLSFTHPRDLDLIQSVPPVDLLNMKAPPRILTLTEQPLDSLETDPSGSSHNNRSHGVRFRGGSQRGGGTNGNSSGHPTSDKNKSDASATPSPSAHPVRVCPPLCSPEDANGHVFTASGFMAYVQSTTRRAYQQVLEVLEDSHNRSNLDLSLEVNHDETGLIDASTLRRQIVKLNRRLQLLEEENKERSKREVILYSATVAFWLLNTWMWFRR